MPHYLHAGSIQVRYENGFLRYLMLDGSEVLRMIYFAIRDPNWLTARLLISNETIEETPDSFRIRYNWQVNDLGIQMAGQVAIQGNSDGAITFDFYGKALNSFQKNRVGLCVLHPIDGIVGQPVEVTEPDGSSTNGHFPTFISPYQPFLTIQTLRWQSAVGTTLQLDFSGDVFEMEDQRNWTDASFKTYSPPLDRPFPVLVLAGDEFRHQVVFSRSERILSSPAAVIEPVIQAAKPIPTQPLIGLGQRADGQPLTSVEANLLRKLNLSHLRTDVFFTLPDWQTRLTNAIADALQLAVPLELAVFFGENPLAEVQALKLFWDGHQAAIRFILLFNAATLITSDELLQAVVPTLRAAWKDLQLGGGTDGNFADLNRNHFDFGQVDFVTYSINPQVHAFDELTLLENIAGQTQTVISAKKLTGGKPIHSSPVTLLPRFMTVVGAATERQTAPADPRQLTEFGADWTRRSLQALTDAGVASVTYFQTHGPAGLVDGDATFPVYSVFLSR